jgi:hypothetical protein
VTVVFRGSWAQVTDIARSNVQGLELVEVDYFLKLNGQDYGVLPRTHILCVPPKPPRIKELRPASVPNVYFFSTFSAPFR